MALRVKRRLEQSLSEATDAGRATATYMLAHLNDLPFETAKTLGRKIGVSELTVGRYCRSLGYRHFKELKNDLKADIGESPWLLGDRLKEFQRRSLKGETELSRSLDLHISAVVSVYEQTQSAAWRTVSERLARIPSVYVAGFQTERGVALSFVHLLQYLRGDVHFIDGSSGHYGDILMGTRPAALVVFEARRYSRQAQLLCQKALKADIPVTFITDPYCDWAEENATEVFRVPTDLNLFWEAPVAMTSLVHLLINAIFNALGPEVENRLNATAALYSEFVGHSSSHRIKT